MRASRPRLGLLAAAIIGTAVACQETSAPQGSIDGPTEVSALAVGTTAIRVSWKTPESADVAGYEIERRTDFQGEFVAIQSVSPISAARMSWLDTGVEPEKYYGYRVRAVSRLGAKSGTSNVAGARTASMPALLIRTSTVFPNSESVDPDGYTALIRGQRDTQSVALGITAERLVPIARGTYSIALRGLSSNCATATASDSVKSATVSDEGTRTVADVTFIVSCRDPRKASIVVTHLVSGDTVDADGLALTVSGIILEPGTPAAERVYFQSRTLGGASGATRFDNLRLGDYDITIADVDAPCVLEGNARRALQPRALAVDTVRFALTCRKPVVIDTVGRPFVLRHAWSSSTARPGDKVSLLTSLDLRAQPSQQASSVSAQIAFDNAVIRYDSARKTSAFDIAPVSRPAPTVLALAATNVDGQGRSGDIQIVRTWFTVVGAVGSSIRTSTTIGDVLTPSPLTQFKSKVRAEEATLTINGTAPANQPPTAVITGPTSATVGTSVTLSGAGSQDPDGTIAGYAWSFGDNSSGTGSSVTHTYSSAGSYVVRLTVTDDRGATAFKEQTIVVTAASATTGTIAGTVSSAQGPIAGATVTVTGGATATTSALGAYTITSVATGSRTVTVSALPSTCTAPAAKTATVAAGATATLDFTVVCTTGAPSGTITGKVTQGAAGAGIAGAQVTIVPAGGSALAVATTAADGSYTVGNVPIGSGATAGTGTITLSGLPAACSNPGSQGYTGLTAAGAVTKDIAITCTVVSLATVTGTITRSTGGPAAGVQVTITPSGGVALAPVTTDAAGVYTVTGVAVGDGAIAVSGLPVGCTNPGAQSYTGATAGGTVTKNITVTCAAAGPHTYPLSGVWGAITNTGPTGRQVTLSFTIDMGAAPGRPDIDGANADPLSALAFGLLYDGVKLDYTSRVLLTPNGELDLGAVNETQAGTAAARTNVALSSTSGGTVTGVSPLIRLVFNIATGTSGAITPTVQVTEALATTNLTNVTSSVVVVPLPVLNIP